MLSVLSAMKWSAIYLAAVVAPMFLMLVGDGPSGRGWWADLSMGIGFVGLAMLGLQLALTARFHPVDAPFGLDAVLRFHRQISFVALALVLAHPAMLLVQDPSWFRLFVPSTTTTAGVFGIVSVVLLAILIGASVWRRRLRLSYELWRVTHGLLAIGVVATALVHIERVGYYVSGPFRRFVWFAMSLGLIGLLLYVRVLRPLQLARRPYRVAAVDAMPGDAWRLTLVPDGHGGLRFIAGQFAWLRLDRPPWSVREHPFSFSSSAERVEELEFTIKELGDDTRRLRELEPGARAYVDGPYGAFSYARNQAAGFVFIAGGVGISPIISMLRTLADVEDQRPMLLLYANATADDVIYDAEFDELRSRLDLQVVRVLERPPEDWPGETGVVDADLLERWLPARPARYAYFVCGPPAMMDAVEPLLLDAGIPRERISSERFDLI
ncbi:MAG: ferric reductase-like transmembrane domain-containing protein [Nitriliruptoraceae bacterium]